VNIKPFDKYEDYIALQKRKTEDPVRREKWLANLEKVAEEFDGVFRPYKHLIKSKALCLGARAGEEVLCLRKMRIDAIGVDLVPNGDLVIEGDVHDLIFEDDAFEFIYTNIFDHVLQPKKFLKESMRVLKSGGIFFVQLQMGEKLDEFGVLLITSPKDFFDISEEICETKTLVSEAPTYKTPSNHGLNWNVLLQKVA